MLQPWEALKVAVFRGRGERNHASEGSLLFDAHTTPQSTFRHSNFSTQHAKVLRGGTKYIQASPEEGR